LRRSNLYRAELDALREAASGLPVPVTQGIKETLYPSVSHDGAWIAYTLQGLNEDLVIAKSDGSQMRRITDDPARDRVPRWSPDGSQIAFMSTRGGRFEIWAIRPDGSGLRQVTQDSPHGGVIYPAWSPDGRQLSYNLPDQMGYIIDLYKPWQEQQPRLARAELPAGSWFWVNDWSHDGTRLAGTIQKLDGGTLGIGVYSLETGKLEAVTNFGQFPRWLPDGRRLLFQASGRIYLADLAGKRTKEILAVSEGAIAPYFDLSWNGKTIVFSLESMESDIWMMSPR
jgi:Tol biopolymer transport system component